jgi:hypothetical protein
MSRLVADGATMPAAMRKEFENHILAGQNIPAKEIAAAHPTPPGAIGPRDVDDVEVDHQPAVHQINRQKLRRRARSQAGAIAAA